MHADIFNNEGIKIGCMTLSDWRVEFTHRGERWAIEFLDRMCGGPTFYRLKGDDERYVVPEPFEGRHANRLWEIFGKYLRRFEKLNGKGKGRRGRNHKRYGIYDPSVTYITELGTVTNGVLIPFEPESEAKP